MIVQRGRGNNAFQAIPMKTFVQTLIRFGTALIPVKNVRRRIRRRLMDANREVRLKRTLPIVRARYAGHVDACRAKLAKGEKLSVAFLLCDASMFSGESVFLRMKDDSRFACSIWVAPRVTRGESFLRETLSKTMETLSARYGSAVRSLYDPATKIALPLDADLVFSSILYEDQTLPDYTTERLSSRSLVSILYYGYGGLFVSNEKKTPHLPNIVFAWRYFVSNEATRTMNLAKNPLLAENLVVAGYCKMDRLEGLEAKAVTARARKKVILCPHHTIDRQADGLALSTFLDHAELFLKLPEMFPEIDFVFRPHPLLFPRLAMSKWWGEARTAAYKRKMSSFSNVEFQQGGDYFASFIDSDAMIHDCGSFLAEYFYTGRPQCYLLQSPQTVDRQFLPFSRKLLDHAYRAFTGGEIVDFIRNVVIKGEDPERAARETFALKEVCVNHPHATNRVIAEIVSSICHMENT